jgi:HEAT repeat protein
MDIPMLTNHRAKFTLILVAALLALPAFAQSEKEKPHIATLTSDSPKPEKALACKHLAIHGTGQAVPALAALLSDPELASWSRIALEAIPDPAADEALRQAMGKLDDKLLVGVINSIGVRRDAKAVEALAQKLKDGDALVASAAAASLGKIGGEQAASVLQPALTAGVPEVRSAAAEGLVLVAERFLADGDRERATKVYDAVRQTGQLPKQRIQEATRGAILARQAAGIPLLIEQLKSQDEDAFAIALRTARELVGGDVTEAIVAELGKSPPERQALMILAIADRKDAREKVLPVVMSALEKGAPPVRVMAATVLETLGDASAVPALVEAAASDNAELAQAARTSLSRLEGKEVDAALFARLQQSGGRMRQVLIELAEQRRLEGALPIFLQSAQDNDPAVRTTALVAIGAIGTDKQMPDLVGLLQKAEPAQRDAIERAVMSIAGRWRKESVPHLMPLAKSGDNATRIAALRALGGCGGPEALGAVQAATKDAQEAVRDEAVRVLSTWPNRWPEDAAVIEPLLSLAKSAEKPAHRVLGLRGYLQHLQGNKKMPSNQRLERIKEAMPLATRAEEKRLAISALAAIGSPGALDALAAFAADETVSDEACTSILTLARNDRLPKDARRKALEAVAQNSKAESMKRRAQEALKAIK